MVRMAHMVNTGGENGKKHANMVNPREERQRSKTSHRHPNRHHSPVQPGRQRTGIDSAKLVPVPPFAFPAPLVGLAARAARHPDPHLQGLRRTHPSLRCQVSKHNMHACMYDSLRI